MTRLSARGLMASQTLRGLAAVFLLAFAALPARADEVIPVQLDQARIIKLPERATTVVIGDPLIADLSLQPGGLAVITGKAYGATNVIVLDRTGAVLMERNVEVKGPPDRLVYVYRGVSRTTYSCTPDCAPRVTLGDDYDFFDKNLAQSTSRSTQALAAGASGGH
ncbi:MAG TPA: pilus assembly protein N-terminal domain-containing protein [Xanthobacteraceae bacterium]|nr:pilus assembly protein N-terminal domain-containing protein [Xanthobacteraceae bacterium]